MNLIEKKINIIIKKLNRHLLQICEPDKISEFNINYLKDPELTHPISGDRLVLKNKSNNKSVNHYNSKLNQIITSQQEKNKKFYFELFESIKEDLNSDKKIPELINTKIPYNINIPDHSTWHENALESAIECSENPVLLFFSFGPMNFTFPTKTFEEFWSASVILSYLLWAAMRVICHELGPDHILYPGVSGQPFFQQWISTEFKVPLKKEVSIDKLAIPSYSNSFVAILPENSMDDILTKIKSSINTDWEKIYMSVYEGINKTLNKEATDLEKWKSKISEYWIFRWGISPWPKFLENIPDDAPQKKIETINKNSLVFDSINDLPNDMELTYQPCHEFSGNRHFGHKMSLRKKETEKEEAANLCKACSLNKNIDSLHNDNSTKKLLNKIKRTNISSLEEINSLCPVCLTRSLASIYNDDMPDQLKIIFKKFKFKNIISKSDKNKYVAVLSMDGDHMSKLTRGESENFATWESILHSGMSEKYKEYLKKNKPDLVDQFNEILKQKRLVTPQVHQFLSESLTDFSIHTIPYVINKYKGQFLYLGGDDVVALFPVENVLKAAIEIRNFYRTSFAVMDSRGKVKPCTEKYKLKKGERLLTHPGKAVTMSAAVIFASANEDSGELLRFARKTLDDEAKDNVGRDGLAVVLKHEDNRTSMVSDHWENAKGESFVDYLMKGSKNITPEKPANMSDELHDILQFILKFL